MNYIDIRIWFAETVEDGYNWYYWNRAELKATDISDDYRDIIAEDLAQSDFGWIQLPNEIIEAIGKRGINV